MDYDIAKYLVENMGEQIAMNQPEQPTLRDRFAMHIMGGTCVDKQKNMQAWNVDKMAEWAYRAADAMMKARGRLRIHQSDYES